MDTLNDVLDHIRFAARAIDDHTEHGDAQAEQLDPVHVWHAAEQIKMLVQRLLSGLPDHVLEAAVSRRRSAQGSTEAQQQ